MSKETSLPLTRAVRTDDGIVVVAERFRRYPLDRKTAEVLGADRDTGHNVLRPRRGKTRRDHASGAWGRRLQNLALRRESGT